MAKKTVKQIYDELNIMTINRSDYNTIMTDRLDFGFDSIYFRYSEAIEELSWYKAQDENRQGNPNFNRKVWSDSKKQHFYNTLEQLLHAHDKEGKE